MRADYLHQGQHRHHHRGQDAEHQGQAGRGEEGAVGQLEAGGDEVDQEREDLTQGDDDEAQLCGRGQPSGDFPGPAVRHVFQG